MAEWVADKYSCGFNPRAREGATICLAPIAPSVYRFNPRAREGATVHHYRLIHYHRFQSTRP